MSYFKKSSICNGVDLIYIDSDKFKTEKISITFFLPLDEKTASYNFVLSSMLKRQCQKYPGFLELDKELAKLYGAKLSSYVFKLGEAHALTISITGIKDRFAVSNEEMSKKISNLLCELVFRPYLDEEGYFSKDALLEQKRELLEKMEAEYNDKRYFAKLRCEELMCKGEPFCVNKYGSADIIKKIKPKDLYIAWQRCLKNARVEIVQIGDSNFLSTKDIFERAFENVDRKYIESPVTKIVEANGIHEYNDTMEVTQCKLVMGFRVDFKEGKSLENRLMTAIFGGTPSSKLFLNVREKLSLCYYCSATYDKNKSIILVQSGVESENIEQAKAEILNQLREMKAGKISQEEIESAQKSLINLYKTSSDSLSSIENFYISQSFDDDILTVEEVCDKLRKITKQEIIDAANCVTLDTIYILRGEDA